MNDSYYNATLRLRGGVCLAKVDDRGHLLDTSAVTCVLAGTEAFHAWFVRRYGEPDKIHLDGGALYKFLQKVRSRQHQEANVA